ncbi:MAG: multiheme c-type cytochrome [Pseudomonadota bacterium]
MKRFVLIACLALAVWSAASSGAQAKDEYARETGKGCIFCHQESTGGGLNTAGFAYIRNGYRYPISAAVLEKAESLQSAFHKTVRFFVGYLHLVAAVIFFGAIFYIHIFIKPATLTTGIPKPERVLGLTCMVVLTATGAYLTWARIDRWEQFFNNSFGLLLFVKILLFAVMVAIGLTAVFFIHRRMSPATDEPAGSTVLPGAGTTDAARPAVFVFEGKTYDVANSVKWKDGRHFGRHQCGTDLTESLAAAPHGREVLDRVPCIGNVGEAKTPKHRQPAVQKVFVVMAYTNLVIIFLILACISVWRWDFPVRLIAESRADVIAGTTCVDCHRVKTPGVTKDWAAGVHARLNVDCYKCHRANTDSAVLKRHLQYDRHPISAVVSPINCGGCHPKQAEEYARSKHANTQEIMWKVDIWLNQGHTNALERTTGCFDCHGTVVRLDQDGRPATGTWPNVGVGRINPDGSLGSCSACHTRHKFSKSEARKPEACDQCHLGPDHPQIEIYNESKHGTIYHAEGAAWEWDPEGRPWTAATDFRAPTCAVCHMSAAGSQPASHDVTRRLSWETQAPLTVRPEDFKPFPSSTSWREERKAMEAVCLQCHGTSWTAGHFDNYDRVIALYNDTYYRPVRVLMDDLYTMGLLSSGTYFDDPLEWQFYEFWHHEGRRARMGTAMMAPDYAWWHGFYELKHRTATIHEAADYLVGHGPSTPYPALAGSDAATTLDAPLPPRP